VVNVYQRIALVTARSSLEHKISLSAALSRNRDESRDTSGGIKIDQMI